VRQHSYLSCDPADARILSAIVVIDVSARGFTPTRA